MYCNQCGNRIPENGAFCTFCGAKAESVAPIMAPVPPVAAPVPQAPAQESAPVVEKKEKQEKYYTAKHIVLCLVVAGVMAAAAGVFAGLYFSVI